MKKNRESNIELLRIVAMFMVMVLHVDYMALGCPSSTDVNISPMTSFARILFENLCVGSVNAFVLISGWFSIKPSLKSLLSFIFQCIFFTWGIFLLMSLWSGTNFSLKNMDSTFFVRSWFIQAYLGLYLLAPALNLFMDKCAQKQHQYVLIGFFLMEFIYDFIAKSDSMFNSGYSTLHFVFLYLLARYLRIYGIKAKFKQYSFALFSFITIILSVTIFIGVLYGFPAAYKLGVYTSPFIVITSVLLFVTFNRMSIRSKIINWFSTSSFAVYLLHTNPLVLSPIYVKYANNIYNNYNMGGVFVNYCMLYDSVVYNSSDD